MPTSRDAILNDLFPALMLSDGYQVTYSRNGATLGTIDAIKGRRVTETGGTDYGVSTHVSDDWIVRVSDLVAAGIDEPERGDVISWTDDVGVVRTHEVNLPGAERQWDYVGQHSDLMRIHCKEILP